MLACDLFIFTLDLSYTLLLSIHAVFPFSLGLKNTYIFILGLSVTTYPAVL